MITLPFPAPPALVLAALDLLEGVRRQENGRPSPGGMAADLERPWEPASCTADLSAAVWGWCDDVVAWMNHEFAWRPTAMVPSCWHEHPHLARELPVLAVLRWQAEGAPVPESVEEWNRYAFPLFCDRMVERLGETTCRTGRHQDWPAQSRYASSIESRGHRSPHPG